MRANGLRRGHFIVLRCACPWIITAVSTAVSTRCLLTPSRPPPPRSRLGIFLSAKAQAGGGVAVWLSIGVSPDAFTTGPPWPPPGGACIVDCHCLAGVLFVFLGGETRDQARAFHRFAVRPHLDHHRCFHTSPCSTLHVRHNPQPTSLPRHRQAGEVAVFLSLACR